jgi:prepilin-type N-terminal cleavage/methylation domain-containing protein
MEILKKIQNEKGYTLVELLVAIALISIILSISIPSVKTVFNIAEKKELMEFKRDLIFARNKAVMENTIYTLRLFIKENRYQITKKDGIVIKDKTMSAGIIIKENNISNIVDFYPTGAPSKAGTIELRNKKNQVIFITINIATGKINLRTIEK